MVPDSSQGRYHNCVRLLLVRHGQTDWHNPKRAQGWTDVPLNATGRAQAAALAAALEDEKIDRVLASDLGRAQDTARALGRNFETDARLRERNYGDWEGGDFASVNRDLAQKAVAEGRTAERVRPPGGESALDVWERLSPLVLELLKGEGTTLVVAHGGSVAAMLCQLILATPASAHSFHFTNGSVTELERRADGFMLLHRLSDDSMLGEVANH